MTGGIGPLPSKEGTMSNYRLHYKKGEVEIQLESTDQKYVDETFDKLLTMSGLVKGKVEAGARVETPVEKSQEQNNDSPSTVNRGEADSVIDIAAIANMVHESDKYADIEKNILHTRSILARILLVFHFAHAAGYNTISTGDVERITDQLGVKIGTANVSNTISANRKYFSASEVRQKGARVPYKLNLQGQKAFEAFAAGQKPQ